MAMARTRPTFSRQGPTFRPSLLLLLALLTWWSADLAPVLGGRRYTDMEVPVLATPDVSSRDLEAGGPVLEALFLDANTSFTYHLEQREISYVRDRVSVENLNRWTQAKMREIFLVPNYPCPMAARVGEWGEGGKWLCNIFPFRNGFKRRTLQARDTFQGDDRDNTEAFKAGFQSRFDADRKTVVYSVGSRDETSFELAMHKLLRVEPHTFDPTLSEKKQEHMGSLDFLHFHNLGFKGRDQRARRGRAWGPLLPLSKVMEMLNHTYVDVLKIDCEGCEVGVMRDLFNIFGRQPPIGQVLMEIHHLVAPWSEIELLLLMEKIGFRMFHSENNDRYLKAHEVAYIHESLVDPSLWPAA